MFEIPAHMPDEHEIRILDHFGEDAVACPAGEEAVGQTILICFTNRCGSAYLASLLAATGRIGHAGEAFNHPVVTAQSQERGQDSFADYCRHVAGRQPAAAFGAVKVGCRQLFMLAKWGYLGGMFADPLFVFTRRADLLDQAISFSIADQTKAWTSRQAPETDELEFSRQDIMDRIDGISMDNALFERFFAVNGIKPLCVDYDGLVANPQGVLDRVANRLKSGPLDYRPERILLARQADDRNRDWRRRFLAGRGPQAVPQARGATG